MPSTARGENSPLAATSAVPHTRRGRPRVVQRGASGSILVRSMVGHSTVSVPSTVVPTKPRTMVVVWAT